MGRREEKITREPERVEVERDREGGREEQGREERRDCGCFRREIQQHIWLLMKKANKDEEIDAVLD